MEAPTFRSNWNLEVVVFVEGGKPENPKKILGARREPTTNSIHTRQRVRESNPGHRGGRRAFGKSTIIGGQIDVAIVIVTDVVLDGFNMNQLSSL